MDNQSKEDIQAKEYNKYVKRVTKTTSLPKNMIAAFLVGGAICALGQVIGDTLKHYDIEEKAADSTTMLILIGLSALFTGLNLYSKLAKFGGAGSLVPITGFANSVAASAIEFRAEGFVMGLGCKIFVIAGPVILYGILSSWILGVIYWAVNALGLM